MNNPLDQLDLHKSDNEIHMALRNFEVKWQRKASRLLSDDRISRL
jgi:hypothetical protein